MEVEWEGGSEMGGWRWNGIEEVDEEGGGGVGGGWRYNGRVEVEWEKGGGRGGRRLKRGG